MADERVPANNNRIECLAELRAPREVSYQSNISYYMQKAPRMGRLESNAIRMRGNGAERPRRNGRGVMTPYHALVVVFLMSVIIGCEGGASGVAEKTSAALGGPPTNVGYDADATRVSPQSNDATRNVVLGRTKPIDCDATWRMQTSDKEEVNSRHRSNETIRSDSAQIDCRNYTETAIRHPRASAAHDGTMVASIRPPHGDNGMPPNADGNVVGDIEPEVLGLNAANVGVESTPDIPASKQSEMHRRAVIDETTATAGGGGVGPDGVVLLGAGASVTKTKSDGGIGHTLSTTVGPAHQREAINMTPTSNKRNESIVAPIIQDTTPGANATASSDDVNDDNESSTVVTDEDAADEYSTEYYFANLTTTPCTVEEEGISCTIDHNVTCVGDQIYCNYTQEEYMDMLYDYIYPTMPEWILIFSHAVVFFMGLVGNALVCIAVYTNYTMRTVTNLFIVNLAVADFFVILFCLPPTVVWDVTETWFMGKALCKIVMYFQTVSITVSVLTLTFISIDRWYAICFPLRYVSTNMRAVCCIAFIWTVALLSDIPEFVYSTTKMKALRFNIKLFTQCVSTWDKNTEKWFYIGRFVLLYILPLLMMTVAYFQIVRVLWKSDTIPGHRESRNTTHVGGYLRSGQSANASTMGQLRARRKAAKMLVAVVVMFASCFLPVHALNIMRYTIDIGQTEVVTVLSLFSHWLCYANSAINPVIYNFMSGKFRREFRNALEKCRCGRARIEDRSLYHSTPASRMHNISPSSRSNYQLTSLRDMTSLRDRQTFQTSFVENGGLNGTNGHHSHPLNHHNMAHHGHHVLNHHHHNHQTAQIMPMLLEDRLGQTKFDANP